jgi:hypothetical protein
MLTRSNGPEAESLVRPPMGASFIPLDGIMVPWLACMREKDKQITYKGTHRKTQHVLILTWLNYFFR